MNRRYITALLVIVLLSMLPLYASGDESPYEAAFGQSIMSGGMEKPQILYEGQDRLITYWTGRADEWTKAFLPAEYRSDTPEDVGGIAILREERLRVANYTNGAKFYKNEYHIKLLDPYAGVFFAEKVFSSKQTAPMTLIGDLTVDPDYKEVEAWIQETWLRYLQEGPPEEVVTPKATDFKYSTESGTVSIWGYRGEWPRIAIPETIMEKRVTEIDGNTFHGRSDIAVVNLPEGVLSIGVCAFASCQYLVSVSIPASVTSIADNAFGFCPNLTLIVPEGSYAAEYAEAHGIPFTYAP